MKRFLLFMYDSYYPSGASGDFCGSFDSVEEAHGGRLSIGEGWRMEHWEIWDTTEGKMQTSSKPSEWQKITSQWKHLE